MPQSKLQKRPNQMQKIAKNHLLYSATMEVEIITSHTLYSTDAVLQIWKLLQMSQKPQLPYCLGCKTLFVLSISLSYFWGYLFIFWVLILFHMIHEYDL